jgi:hypothetical protein
MDEDDLKALREEEEAKKKLLSKKAKIKCTFSH